MSDMLHVLMIEDVITDAELALHELRRVGLRFTSVRVESRAEFLMQLGRQVPDIILCDFALPAFDGMSALAIAVEKCPLVPFIFVSGAIGEETAMAALKSGAVDYLLKSNLQRLASAVLRAIDEARSRAQRIQAENRFRDLIEYAPHAIVVVDQDGRIEIVNAEAELLFGQHRAAMLGAHSNLLVTDDFAQWHTVLSREHADGRRTVSIEVTGRRSDGSLFPAEVSLSPLRTASGEWISSVIRDLTDRKAQEDRLARMTRIRTILGSINSVILRVRDKQKLLDDACRIACVDGEFAGAVVGLVDPGSSLIRLVASAGSNIGDLSEIVINTDPTLPVGNGIIGIAVRERRGVCSNDVVNDPRLQFWRDRLLERGYRSAFVVPLMVGGQPFGILALLASQPNAFNQEEQQLLSELAADISFAYDFIGKEEQINYLAYFDVLTGLPNRVLFLDRLSQLTSGEDIQTEKIALVLIDIERFRQINETFGRAAADELLAVVARRLRSCLPEDAYLAHIGTDVFAFLIKGHRSETDVAHLIESRISAVVGESMHIREKNMRIATRAGVAVFPADGADADSLLRNAEAALSDAKSARARYQFYTSEMNARTAEKMSLEYRLRRALEEKQFVLHYQPKIDLRSGGIVGMEALIRWDEPGVGMVSPLEFIHVLEDTGLILEVGMWVIDSAQRQYQQWCGMGLDVPRIAVNVSQLQIRQKDFVSRVLNSIDRQSPFSLEIEITESLFMDDLDANSSHDKLVSLRAAGVTVAIDDFGTGYSSLGYLARLPIDVLKIDRSFIIDMTTSAQNRAIVATIISLAHALNLKVVAEGVEHAAQRDLLQQLGCDQMQGYLFSPGVPAAQMAAMLTSR